MVSREVKEMTKAAFLFLGWGLGMITTFIGLWAFAIYFDIK